MKHFNEEDQGSLLTKTLTLLKESELKPHEIYAETNLPFHWLQSLAKGKTKAPNVNRIQYLYEFLSKKTLKV